MYRCESYPIRSNLLLFLKQVHLSRSNLNGFWLWPKGSLSGFTMHRPLVSQVAFISFFQKGERKTDQVKEGEEKRLGEK